MMTDALFLSSFSQRWGEREASTEFLMNEEKNSIWSHYCLATAVASGDKRDVGLRFTPKATLTIWSPSLQVVYGAMVHHEDELPA